MSASSVTRKDTARSSDRTDRFFYWAIGSVVAVGLAANLYLTYTEEAPSMSTFLDLLTAPKTNYCSTTGEVVYQNPITTANCLDHNGYRIVQGPTTFIYEIQTGEPASSDKNRLTKVAEFNSDAMKGLFNIGGLDIAYAMPEHTSR